MPENLSVIWWTLLLSVKPVSQTRHLTEIGGGCTFFWIGKNKSERREAEVGFAIKNHIVKKLDSVSYGLNDRLMILKLPLREKRSAILISVYAPTMTNTDDIMDKFYEEQETLVSTVSQSDKLILLVDFNARVGKDYQAWQRVLGHHGIGNCNSNGENDT